MFCMLRINASACVTDGNADFWAMMALPRRFEDVQAQCATVGHSLDRVSNKIEEYLFQLDWETPDGIFATVLLVQRYIVEFHATRLHIKNFVEKCRNRDFNGVL